MLKEPPAAKAAGYERATADSVHAALAGAFLGTYRKKDRTDGYRCVYGACIAYGVHVCSRSQGYASRGASADMLKRA